MEIDERLTLTPAEPPEPEPSAPVIEVISVEDLLGRLTQAEPDEPYEDELPEAQAAAGEIVGEVVDETVEQIRLAEISGKLDVLGGHLRDLDRELTLIESRLDHPLLTTSFEDYSVGEGLLLLLLLCAFAKVCMNMIKGAFSWLP